VHHFALHTQVVLPHAHRVNHI